VRIAATGSRGRVVEVRADRVLVEAGALRLEVPLHELEPTGEGSGSAAHARVGAATGRGGGGGRRAGAPDEQPAARGRGSAWRGPAPEPRIEIDLRGLRVDEMEAELTRALDEAHLADLPELRIIHGKGTGALRQRVAEMLESDTRVGEFRMGRPEEGGAGVTVARLR
jgi:dsDNA-specific endonuclease/ATPase MutS2